jgi:hypothetical protein
LSLAPIAQNLNPSTSITEDHQSSTTTTFVAPSQDTSLTTSLIRSCEKSDSWHELYNVPL